MARAAIPWSIAVLAKEAGVQAMTISKFENGGDAYRSTVDKLQRALEGAGVVFVGETEASMGGGEGVRMTNPYLDGLRR